MMSAAVRNPCREPISAGKSVCSEVPQGNSCSHSVALDRRTAPPLTIGTVQRGRQADRVLCDSQSSEDVLSPVGTPPESVRDDTAIHVVGLAGNVARAR